MIVTLEFFLNNDWVVWLNPTFSQGNEAASRVRLQFWNDVIDCSYEINNCNDKSGTSSLVGAYHYDLTSWPAPLTVHMMYPEASKRIHLCIHPA